jgi:hypothetical protein
VPDPEPIRQENPMHEHIGVLSAQEGLTIGAKGHLGQRYVLPNLPTREHPAEVGVFIVERAQLQPPKLLDLFLSSVIPCQLSLVCSERAPKRLGLVTSA